MDKDVLMGIIKKHGTPIYVYDADKIISQYNCLKNMFPNNFEIFFSVKSNPLLGLCQLFKSLGSGIEIASKGELDIALKAGFESGDIIFTSPGKSREELRYAIDNNIYSINIESLDEAKIIEGLLSEEEKANISIRINPDFNISGASIKMTGVPSQFGIDQSRLEEAVKAIKAMRSVNIIGIHVYTGTQILSAKQLTANIEEIIKLAISLSDQYGFELKFLDLGGGFGVPYFPDDEVLNTEQLKQNMSEIWERYKGRLAKTRVVVESGRFLLAESGCYATSVLYRKQSKGSGYIVCDGGSNQHASSAFLGRFIRNNFPMFILGKEDQPKEEVTVVGPLCTSTDVIGHKVKLPTVKSGDILVIEKSGAYGLTHSPAMFLSHPAPAEVIYRNGEPITLRERGMAEDFLCGQRGLYT